MSIARDEIEDARGQADVVEEFRKPQRGEGRVFGGLHDDGISRCQRRCHLPRHHQQREIPRDDLPDHAMRVVAGELALQQLRPPRMVVEMPRDERNVDVACFAYGFSVVERFKHCEMSGMLLNAAGDRVQPARTHVAVERLPCGQRRARRRHGSLHIGTTPLGDISQSNSGRGIADAEVLAVDRWHERPADVVTKTFAARRQPLANWRVTFGRWAIAHFVEQRANGRERVTARGGAGHSVHEGKKNVARRITAEVVSTGDYTIGMRWAAA